jgi:hypothetical protein
MRYGSLRTCTRPSRLSRPRRLPVVRRSGHRNFGPNRDHRQGHKWGQPYPPLRQGLTGRLRHGSQACIPGRPWYHARRRAPSGLPEPVPQRVWGASLETVTGDTPGTVPRVSPQTIPEAALESVRWVGQLTVRGGATGAIPGSAHGSVRGGGLRIREGGGPGWRV